MCMVPEPRHFYLCRIVKKGLKDSSIVKFSADFGNASLIKILWGVISQPCSKGMTIVGKSLSQNRQEMFILMATIPL